MNDAAVIDADDLALLAGGFEGALRDVEPSAGVAALFDLGWGEALAASPRQVAAAAFTALGATGSAAGLVDDVVLHALGLEPSPATAVLLPAPGSPAPPARRIGDRIVVDGMATSRLDGATTVVVPIDGAIAVLDALTLTAPAADALDAGQAYRRVRVELHAADVHDLDAGGSWAGAVAAGRAALAHQLVAASRVMLEQAREHAVDRSQFGRPVASFQAVRHRLAEALVQIEGAAGVAGAAVETGDPLVAALAKSLAGQAALTTAGHAQQVLAGMGFTTDHPFQAGLKRVLVLDTVLGSAKTLPAEIGAALLRLGHAPRLVELP